MTANDDTTSIDVRRGLDHPVIDADGHWIELFPVFWDYIDDVGGPAAVDRFKAKYGHRFHRWYEVSPEERLRNRWRRPSFWGMPTNTQDRAATSIPKLFHESLDRWGIDVALVFPTVGLTISRDLADPDFSAQIIRAYNTMAADVWRPYVDRVVPVGILSLVEPTDAIEQMDHATSLGLRALVTGGTIPRTVEADAEWQPDPAKRRIYIDALAIDSPYDYEPVWQHFVDLKLPLCSHAGSMGWPDRSLVNSFVGNHLGHFAQSHHTFARSLFLGGVTQRHPGLNVGFMEGGISWACSLYADLFAHWEKRNAAFMNKHLKPTNVDRDEFRRLYELYTKDDPAYVGKIDEVLAANLDALESDTSQEELTERDADADEFGRVDITSEDDIRRLFAGSFYFGCEADDPMTAIAFDDEIGLRLKPLLGSDIAHFDVIDATEVLAEAFELVEDGFLTEQHFREFTFSNAVQLYQGMNPDFFEGTIVEEAAAAELGRTRAQS